MIMRKTVIVLALILTLIVAPAAAIGSDAAAAHTGGTGHGDGIDVEYTENGNEYIVFVMLSAVPSSDVRLSVISASEPSQTVGPIGAAKVFGAFLNDALNTGTYTVLVTIASTGAPVAECQLTVGDVCYVTYAPNGGTGEMLPGVSENNSIVLRDCTFGPPSGKSFRAWSVNGNEYNPGDKIQVTGDITAEAVWGEGPAPSPSGGDSTLIIIGAAAAAALLLLVITVFLVKRKG